MHKKKLVYNMGHRSYILFVCSDESKQRILDAIKTHNTFYDDRTEEAMNDPNFQHEVGNDLNGIVYKKLLKAK